MKEIRISGYLTNPAADDAIALAIYGDRGSGKTRFACTAPGPIGFIPLERKSRRTITKMVEELGGTDAVQVVIPKQDFVRLANPMKAASLPVECKGRNVTVDITKPQSTYDCCSRHYYRWHVDTVKHAIFELYGHPQIRTIVIDSGTQLWEDMLFAEFGRSQRIMPRDRGAVNQEMTDLLNAVSGKHLIITHHSSQVWKNDKPTDQTDVKGFAHIGYHVNGIVEFVLDEKKGSEDDGRFYINVPICQSNPDIQGRDGKRLLMDWEITFANLAEKMYPGTEGEWE